MKSCIYTFGKLKIIVKLKYAYHYNAAGSVIGRTDISEPGERIHFIKQIYEIGYERDEQDYQKSQTTYFDNWNNTK